MFSVTKSIAYQCLGSFLLVSILVPFTSHAQRGGGSTGGGSGILCYKGGAVLGVESYDFYKGRSGIYGFTIPKSTAPYMNQVQSRIDRLRRLDVRLADQMQALLPAFSPSALESGNGPVIFVDRLEREGDEALDIAPGSEYLKTHGCDRVEVARVASFYPFEFPGQARFHLLKKTWNLLDDEAKAAIVQHEMIYSLAKHYFENPTSTQAQYFNAFISSVSFESLKPQEYYKTLRELKWYIDYQIYHETYPKTFEGLLGITMSTIRFRGTDFLMEDGLTVSEGKGYLNFTGYVLPKAPPIEFEGQKIFAKVGRPMTLSEDGGFSVVNMNSFTMQLPGYRLQFLSLRDQPDSEFTNVSVNHTFADGKIEAATLPFASGTLQLPRGSQVRNLRVTTGELKEFSLPSGTFAVYTSAQGRFPLVTPPWENNLTGFEEKDGKIQTAYFRFCGEFEGQKLVIDSKVIRPTEGSEKLKGVYNLFIIGKKYVLRNVSSGQCK